MTTNRQPTAKLITEVPVVRHVRGVPTGGPNGPMILEAKNLAVSSERLENGLLAPDLASPDPFL